MLGVSEEEKVDLLRLWKENKAAIDPVVLIIVGATSGYAYKHLIGNDLLKEYPIPTIPFPPSEGATLLDIGCNWGRWCIAAARKGYAVAGVDPSLGAVMAARRVARELGLNIRFVVGDARFLPFREASFDCIYSYSVLQHFSKENARRTFASVGRILAPGGTAKIQMANKWGIRSLQHQARRGFREPIDFEVRYWSVPELRAAFNGIRRTRIEADCYFGLGLQWDDFKYMRPSLRAVLVASEAVKWLSKTITPLRFVADSVFCTAVKVRA